MRLPFLLAVLTIATALTACGDDERQSVDSYVKEVNSIQRRSAPAFKRAQEAYVAFSRDSTAPPEVQRRLDDAERSLRATRAELGRLRPPDEAAELQRRLLRVYDMTSGLARETAQLGRYLPAAEQALEPLPAAGRRLETGLRESAGPEGQQRTLGRYVGSTRDVVADLRRLDPPPLLQGQHGALVGQLESARSLARRLNDAIGARNADRAARLLLRFRRLNQGADGGQERRAARALVAYRERYRAIGTAQVSVHRELGRLERSLD